MFCQQDGQETVQSYPWCHLLNFFNVTVKDFLNDRVHFDNKIAKLKKDKRDFYIYDNSSAYIDASRGTFRV